MRCFLPMLSHFYPPGAPSGNCCCGGPAAPALWPTELAMKLLWPYGSIRLDGHGSVGKSCMLGGCRSVRVANYY